MDGRIRVRWPLTGLAGAERIPGTLAFVAVMLGSVLFDGYSRTTTWQDLAARVEGPYIVDQPLVGELLVTLAQPRRVARGGVARRRGVRGRVRGGSLGRQRARAGSTGDFLLSLVPIAFVYVVAHYFSTFVSPGAVRSPAPLRPAREGAGTSSARRTSSPNLAVVSPNTTWYVQVGALVAGHVAGLAIAHDRAVTIFPDRRTALRSQYRCWR